MTYPVLVERIVRAIEAQPAVDALDLVGSQREGTATPLSDWDFKIETTEPEMVFRELHTVVSTFDPLAAFWDPLGSRRNYMAIFPGPLKLDFHVDMDPLPARPWVISVDTMPAVDAHFWDWSLWLAGKTLRGKRSLIADELAKMHRYLLGPMGCDRPPRSLDEAVALYLEARSESETKLDMRVAGNPFEAEVRAALVRHGIA